MNLPDDLADLERDLAARNRPDPPANLRPRVLSAVAHELSRPHTRSTPSPYKIRSRQLLIAAGLAASIALAFVIWRRNIPQLNVTQPVVLKLPSDGRLTTWRDCRHALNQSPANLDQLLEQNASKTHSPPPQTFLHTHTNFLAIYGDL